MFSQICEHVCSVCVYVCVFILNICPGVWHQNDSQDLSQAQLYCIAAQVQPQDLVKQAGFHPCLVFVHILSEVPQAFQDCIFHLQNTSHQSIIHVLFMHHMILLQHFLFICCCCFYFSVMLPHCGRHAKTNQSSQCREEMPGG